MERNTNACKLKNEKYSTSEPQCASLEGSVMSLNFRFVGNEIPALALAFGLSLFSVNTPVLADDIKNLGQEIENLKGKIQELENKYKSILEQSSASEGTKASKPAASAIAVGVNLNGAQIKSLFSGKAIKRVGGVGTCDPFRIVFKESGRVKVYCNANSDDGKWFIKDDTLGLEMERWWSQATRRYTITKAEGDTVVANAHSGFNFGGGKWTWKIVSP